MGCGSSAAVRLAGVALASVFGDLGWGAAQIVERAAQLEGHPDNVAACWHGGLTIAAHAQQLAIVSIPPPPHWRALLVLPETPVPTAKARGMLPQSYGRQDVVMSVQCVALLTAAFSQGRADLMQLATRDRLHQPYRAQLCPLLPALLPLAGSHGVKEPEHGNGSREEALKGAILELARPVCPVEILPAGLCREGATMSLNE
jgi:homoserine kinase